MAASAISGPGILFVISKIAAPDVLDEAAYMKWYETDHISEIVETAGIKSALRYKNKDPSADKPYLVMYPMDDIGFTQEEEFKKIKVHSDLLPNGGPIYDLADIDVRYYGLIQTYDPNGPTKPGTVKQVLIAGIKPGDDITDKEFDDWYRQEHLALVAKTPGFIRTTRFKLLYYRTNAQSRTLKGLPARTADVAIKEPPPYLALYEFDVDDLNMEELMKPNDTEWAKKIMGSVKTLEVGFWELKGAFGEEKFFHDS